VQPGDTLWAIATRVAPKGDPRVTVQQIVDRNGLAGASIEAGQVLVLPS
jgi:LysM repeat protein